MSELTLGWHFCQDVEAHKGNEIESFFELQKYEGKVVIFEDADTTFSDVCIVGRYIPDQNYAYAQNEDSTYEQKPSLPYDIVETWRDEKRSPSSKGQVSELFYRGRYELHEAGRIFEYVA